MTCIVAIKDQETGDVVLAGDALTSSWSINHSISPKVFLKDGIGFGCCGRVREKNLLEHAVSIPKRVVGEEADRFVICGLVPAIRDAMSSNGSRECDKGRESVDSEWIVVVDGRLFKIGVDYAVTEFEDRFLATGSGGELAIGALFALDAAGVDMDDAKKARTSIEAASRFCGSVGGKITVLTIKAKKEAK